MTNAKSPQPSPRLFVGALPYRFTEGELLSLFIPFGKIISIRIIHNQWGKSRGLGFVEFDNLDSAIKAKNELHNYKISDDRTIIVDFAQVDPMTTPEGRARFKNRKSFQNKKTTPNTTRRQSKSSRQSVYISRHYHSSVGAKFASKRRAKVK